LGREEKKEKIRMATLKIHGSKKYLNYLGTHLQKEHPKTKGKISGLK
jgi:hypothetical protein